MNNWSNYSPRGKKYLVLPFMILFLNLTLNQFAQEDLKFDRITIEKGLSNNAVLCILQDTMGFMWFGTIDGLNRYDGYKCVVYKHASEDINSLSQNYIRCLYEDKSGTIWVGTFNGLNKFDRKSETFTRYKHDPTNPNSLSHPQVMCILEDNEGILWIATLGGGLNKFNRKAQSFNHYKYDKNNSNCIKYNYITSLFQDKKGYLWIGTNGNGINRLDIKNEKFDHYKYKPDDPKSFRNNVIRDIYEDKAGNFWIGTYGGFNQFYPDTGEFTHWTHDPNNPQSISINSVFKIQEDKDGKLWIATFGGGLNRFDPINKTFTHWRHNTLNLRSLGSDNLFALYIDRVGNIWLGSNANGVSKSNSKTKPFTHYYHKPKDANSLSENSSISSFFEDQKGNLWIGTFGGGLNKYDSHTKTFNHYKHDPKNPHSLSHNSVMAICGDNSGILWVGTEGGGLNRFNPATERFSHYRYDSRNRNTLSHNAVDCIKKDKAGNLWIGTLGGGLNRFNPKTGEFTRWFANPKNPEALNNNWVTDIFQDSSGTLWIGARGIHKFNQETETFTRFLHDDENPKSLSNNNINAFFESKEGILWIGTFNGLNKFDHHENSFSVYNEKDGLPNNVICGIQEDNQGNLWIITFKGLSKFNPRLQKFKNFDVRDGLQSNQFSSQFYKSPSTGLFFCGGINGYNAFFPKNIKDNPHIPPVVFTDFKIFNESIKTNQNIRDGRSPLQTSITEAKVITLSHKDSVFSFEFASLDYSIPEKNQYAYKMEGFEENWTYSGTRHYVTYTNLDPGKYTFRVKGSNNDNVWNEEGAAITIIVTPPFWKTWWFTGIALIVFAITSYFIINLSKKYITLSTFWKRKTHIGGFIIESQIGYGGMANIFKARPSKSKSSHVALKLLKDEIKMETQQRKRFDIEASIIDGITHPNIVKIIKRGEYEGKAYIAMELIEGETLDKWIEKSERVSFKDRIEIMIQLISALKEIHSKGIVHRDLKPENIMVATAKNNSQKLQVKLLDFGLAKSMSLSRLTETGMLVGTIYYVPPEQLFHSEISFASDIYALGMVFYEMITGFKAFSGENTVDIMQQILSKEVKEPKTFNPDTPEKLNEIVLKMIDRTPQNRPSVEELQEFFEKNL
jgi:ligand-binding sensor domain-containing protein/tRNA A-37 threonylcarbamoyl transferase component Bud32